MVGANRQLWNMIRHPAFCHSGQSQRRSSQEYMLWLFAGQGGKLKSLLCWYWTSFRDLYGFVTYWDKRCTRLDSNFKRRRLDVQLQDDGVLCRLLQGNKRTWCDFQWRSRKRIPTFELRNVLQDDLPCCKLAEISRPQLTSLVICERNRFAQPSNMSRWPCRT